MFRACMTFTLMAFFLLGVSGNVEAKTKKKKAGANSAVVSTKKNRKNKSSKVASRTKRYRRSGTGPDLRALTTEKPNTEYIENPDNGVNTVETKSEL